MQHQRTQTPAGGQLGFRHLQQMALGLACLLMLAACNTTTLKPQTLESQTPDATDSGTHLSPAAVVTNVAWNERVELAVSSNFPVTVRYGTTVLPVVQRSNGRVVFDLPAAPALSSFSTTASVDISTFNTVPSGSELNSYVNHGTIDVLVTRSSNGALVTSQSYQPFGSVESGELTVIGPPTNGQCPSLPSGFSNVEGPFSYEVSGQTVCLRTVLSNARGTAAAKSTYAAVQPTQSVDRNIVSSLDPTGKGSLDPNCGQIEKWLNPITSGNFGNLNMGSYQTVTNASNRGGISGSMIRVHVVGSGIGVNDLIDCGPAVNFQDHDTHIRDLIQTLAPNVSIFEKKVCDDNGNCPASSVAKGLLEIGQTASSVPNTRNDIINLSLGAPIPGTAVYQAIKYMESDVLVVASGGNHPFAADHFPASHANGLGKVAVPLQNLISVAGTGLENSSATWQVAGYNTRKNANLFAPGAGLCPPSALSFRCNATSVLPYGTVGIAGSSFAAPGVTGIAALYLQRSGRVLNPSSLKTCLETKSNSSTVFNGGNLYNGMVWYDPAGC
jgi:Subtilase family